MAFNYAQLNIETLDRVRPILARPSTDWTDKEATIVALFIEAVRVVAAQREKK